MRTKTSAIDQPHWRAAELGYRVRMDIYPIPGAADRRNTRLAAVVEFAVAMSADHGARAAARFLDVHGAGLALIVRVLRDPSRRRPSVDLATGQR